MKHKRDGGPEKPEDEAVDVTPVMICVFVAMCCAVLVLLYYFYDQLGAPPPRAPGGPRPSSPAHPQEPRCLGAGGMEPPSPAARRGPWRRELRLPSAL